MKKIFSVIVLCLILSPMAGCVALDVYKDKDGIYHTKAGDVLAVVGKGMKDAGAVVPG